MFSKISIPVDSCIYLYKNLDCYIRPKFHELSLALKDKEIIGCQLSLECDFDLYEIIRRNSLFNLFPEICIHKATPTFEASSSINVEIILKPENLRQLSQENIANDKAKLHFLKQSKAFQLTILEIERLPHSQSCIKTLYPLLFTENWLALSVQQHLPTGTIGYKTIWSHFSSLSSPIEEASQEQVSESISNFIQDLAGIGINSETQQLAPDSLEETAALLRELASQTTDITSPDIIISKSLIFDSIITFFKEENWPFTKLKNQPVLRLAFEGKNGQWDCYAQAIEKKQQFVFYSVCSFPVPQDKIQSIAELITRANYGMILGNFEFDYTDGEIRYKTSIDVEGSTLDSALIQNLVYTNIMTMDQYLPGILAVLDQGVPPSQAIQLVEANESDA
ncbi:MAG: YbjN domain-containing protein [Cyanobacteria bacterium P01_D01_bin.156]